MIALGGGAAGRAMDELADGTHPGATVLPDGLRAAVTALRQAIRAGS